MTQVAMIVWCISAVLHAVAYISAPADDSKNSLERDLYQIKELVWIGISIIMAVLVTK